ncbi:MAG TPA: MFS transporter [Patescibacteria group bacterium]|nr:MFS transporter [Patescibacteria group bacterium]
MVKLSSKTKVLLWGSNIWYLGEGMLGPLFAVFSQKVGGNVLDITWAWAAYLAVTGVLTIWVGKVAGKKIAPEKLMIAGYIVNALFTFAYLLVSAPWHLLLVQIGLGVAVALSVPTWSALYSDSGEDHEPSYLWSLPSGQYYLVTAAAVILGGLIVNYLSFTVLFLTMGIIQITATIYQARILRHT